MQSVFDCLTIIYASKVSSKFKARTGMFISFVHVITPATLDKDFILVFNCSIFKQSQVHT